MGMPVPVCLFRKALTDDKALAELQRRLKFNKKFGAMSIWPCTGHKPPCKMVLEEKEVNLLNKRLKDLDEGITRA
jgi:hypothetical protein